MRKPFVFIVLLTLLGLALRVHNLDGQSFWSDEGLSLYRAQQPTPQILNNIITVDGVDTQDTNPPLYFLLLHLWKSAVGDSVFGLRLVGVLAGTLSIPALYSLSKRLLNESVARGAAVLMAVSPFHIWQCQELRNYSLLLLFNLLAVYSLVRFLKPTRELAARRWLVFWTLSSLAGIYTHYFGFFVFAFGVLCLISRYLRSKWLWIALGLSGLIVSPILPVAFNRFAAGQQVDFVHVPILHLLNHAASVYSVGIHPTIVQPAWRVFPLVTLAGLGLLLNAKRDLVGMLILLGYQIVPLAILVVLSAFNPLYNGPRHLLIGLPPFLVLSSAGILSLGQRWRWFNLIFGLVLLNQLQWLGVQFNSPGLIKDDIRGAADYLNTAARRDDVIILHDALIQFTFDYYYHGPAPWIVIPEYGNNDTQTAASKLEQTGKETSGRIWFLTKPHPRTGFHATLLVDQADQDWQHLFGRYFDWLWLSVRLDGYLPNPAISALPASATPATACWPDAVCLAGYQFTDDLRSGEPWWPTFFWRTDSTKEQDELTLSLQLIDKDGRVWLQSDRSLQPASEGAFSQHEHQTDLPAGLPPGAYQLELRVLSGPNNAPMTLANGEKSLPLPPMMMVNSAAGESARWLGSSLEIADFQLAETEYRPGSPIPVEINWRVRRSPPTDLLLELQLVNQAGTIVSTSNSSPTRSDYPTSQWLPGETLMSKAGLQIPAQTPAGRYKVTASLVNPDNHKAVTIQDNWFPFGPSSIRLGEIVVAEWPLLSELPTIENEFHAELGSPSLAELFGYDLVQSDDSLILTLYWQAHHLFDADYQVFVHLADENEQIATQSDSVPAGGTRPTTTWRANEYIIDTHSLPLSTLAPGETYSLWIGMYNAQQRLPITVNGDPQADGRLLLQIVGVAP